jgi:hypothetical protein
MRKGEKMRKITFAIFVVLLGTSSVWGLPNWDIYSDATIEEGDEYNVVSVYDTPPDHSTVGMTGGWVDTLDAYNESTINITSGIINTLNSWESSHVNVFGGSIYALDAYDTSTVNVWASGAVDVVVAHGSAFVDMSGGSVGRIGATEFGTVRLAGGLVADNLSADGSGVIDVYGYDLSKVGTGGHYGFGFVSGQWQSHTGFNIDLMESTTYSRVVLHEIPEPSTFSLIIASILLFRKKRVC